MLRVIIPPPPPPPPQTKMLAAQADLTEQCPICGCPDKAKDQGAVCVGNESFIGLQFTCALCLHRWVKPPIRPDWSPREGRPAQLYKPLSTVRMVDVGK